MHTHKLAIKAKTKMKQRSREEGKEVQVSLIKKMRES